MYESTERFQALVLNEENKTTIEAWGATISEDPMEALWGHWYVYSLRSSMICAILTEEDFLVMFAEVPE